MKFERPSIYKIGSINKPKKIDCNIELKNIYKTLLEKSFDSMDAVPENLTVKFYCQQDYELIGYTYFIGIISE
jgi:hypothetical protein